jgi:hypothetical protein
VKRKWVTILENGTAQHATQCLSEREYINILVIEEYRLLGYKNPVRTSQETHYVSATKSMQDLRFSRQWLWRMLSSGTLRHVALVRTDVSEERSASFIRVTRIGELGTTLAVTSKRRTLRGNTWYFIAGISFTVASYS